MESLEVEGNTKGAVLGGKVKYQRIDSANADEEFDESLDCTGQLGQNKNARKYVFTCAVFACLNFILLGYDVGVMSGAIIFIKEDLKITEVQEEVLISILGIISLLGSLTGGKTSDIIGRKRTMAASAIVFQAGAVVMTLAPSFQMLMLGRLLAGFGIGFGAVIAVVYIAEIAPAISRGSLTSFPEIFINAGILLGYVSNYAFAGLPLHIGWRIMLGIGILPSIFVGFALFIIPESPRWLVLQNRVEEARSVLLKTSASEHEAEERLEEIQLAAGIASTGKNEEKAVWRELMHPSPALGRMLIAGIGIQCFQQITGIDSIVYYSPEIFKEAGAQGNSYLFAATVGVGISKTIFILVAIILIDRLGRKPLLYAGTIGMTLCLFMLGIILSSVRQGQAEVALAVVFVCGNVAFFSIGIGPIAWVLTSEIYPLKVRAQAAALGSVGNRICSGLITMSFLTVARTISVAGTFFLFAAFSALSVAFVYKCVPETKGKSLEQIEMLFQNQNELRGNRVELVDECFME